MLPLSIICKIFMKHPHIAFVQTYTVMQQICSITFQNECEKLHFTTYLAKYMYLVLEFCKFLFFTCSYASDAFEYLKCCPKSNSGNEKLNIYFFSYIHVKKSFKQILTLKVDWPYFSTHFTF